MTGATVTGRTLARNGAVTLDTNTVTALLCASGGTPGVCPAISLSPGVLNSGTVGVAYSQTLTGSGGRAPTAPYVFTVTAGTLPSGLTLTSAGVLSGTPLAASASGVTIRATDASGCFAERTYALTILTAVPTLPETFAIGLALGLAALGYVRLRRRNRSV